jgi:MFS family permease
MEKHDRQAWIIAISLFIALFFVWGGGYNTAPIFLGALLRAFHWSHARVAWMVFVLSLSVGVSQPIAGWLLDRFEARYVMGAGAALAGLGFISAGRSNTLEGILFSVLLLGVGLGASTWLPASLIIANWFGERRGTALGVATAGMEAGGMAMTYISGYIIANHGWRAAYTFLAIPTLVIVMPLLLVVARTRPPAAAGQSAAESARNLPGLEMAEALRTRAFWMLVLAQLSFGLAVGGSFHHLVAFLEGLGYTVKSATLVISIILGMAAVGKATMGAVADRIGGRYALSIGYVMISVSILILLGAAKIWMVGLWLLVAGIFAASPVALVPMVLAETLGLRRFGSLFGLLGFTVTVGLSIGPVVVGWITDITGSYTFAFELCAAVALVGAVSSYACVAPQPATAPATMPQARSAVTSSSA